MAQTIDISGIPKEELLLGLWRGSKMQGMSFMGYEGDLTMTRCKVLVKACTKPCRKPDKNGHMINSQMCYFDYLNGKVLKVDIGGDELDPWLYDRDNGNGTAERVVQMIRDGRLDDISSGDPETRAIMNLLNSARASRKDNDDECGFADETSDSDIF